MSQYLYLGCLLLILVIVFPFIAGIILVTKPARFSRLAGWYTLKPVITTPLLILSLLGWLAIDTLRYIGLLPGIILLIAIPWAYRDLFAGENRVFSWSLLGLDVLRWGSALLVVITLAQTAGCIIGCGQFSWETSLLWITLGFPTLYAVAALVFNKFAVRPVSIETADDLLVQESSEKPNHE